MKGLVQQVEEWLGSGGAFSLELPNRWFGRPMDNRHRLTAYCDLEERSFLEADKRICLLISQPASLSLDTRVAEISAAHVVFDRRGYGSAGRFHTEVFEDCTLRLHRH